MCGRSGKVIPKTHGNEFDEGDYRPTSKHHIKTMPVKKSKPLPLFFRIVPQRRRRIYRLPRARYALHRAVAAHVVWRGCSPRRCRKDQRLGRRRRGIALALAARWRCRACVLDTSVSTMLLQRRFTVHCTVPVAIAFVACVANEQPIICSAVILGFRATVGDTVVGTSAQHSWGEPTN